MSKTVDDLVRVYCDAFYAQRDKDPAGGITQADRAGIAAVIRALRDEVVKSNDMDFDYSVARYLDEILGSDAGAEKVAGGPTREDGQSCNSSDGSSPATDPAPAVCEWNLLERKQGIATWSSDHRWHAFFTYEKAPLLCDECGLPIKFTEAK